MKNITVSVDDKIYKEVRVLAAHLEISVSELVRRKNSYELGKDLFGNGSFGSTNLSRDRKKILKGLLQKKYAKRNSR